MPWEWLTKFNIFETFLQNLQYLFVFLKHYNFSTTQVLMRLNNNTKQDCTLLHCVHNPGAAMK